MFFKPRRHEEHKGKKNVKKSLPVFVLVFVFVFFVSLWFIKFSIAKGDRAEVLGDRR